MKTLLRALMTLLIMLSITSVAKADVETTAAVRNLIAGYGNNPNVGRAYLYQLPYKYWETIDFNEARVQPPYKNELTPKVIQNLYAPGGSSKMVARLATIPGSDTHTKKGKPDPGMDFVNAATLMGTTQFESSKQMVDANAFVLYFTNPSSPLQVPTKQELREARGDADKSRYVVALREYAAGTSLGVDNLYQLYQERVKSKEVNQKKYSPLEIDRFIATRRVADKSWFAGKMDEELIKSEGEERMYRNIDTATPAALQREMVTILAEIEYQLFQQRLILERTMATISAQQLAQVQTTKFNLSEMYTNMFTEQPNYEEEAT